MFHFSDLDDASDVAAPEVIDSHQPPADCEEEEEEEEKNNPYDNDRWVRLILCPILWAKNIKIAYGTLTLTLKQSNTAPFLFPQ